jgi:hypothetical protein
MVNEFFFPELHTYDTDLATVWLTPHNAQQSMNISRTVSEHEIISHYGNTSWPAYKPNLSTCYFFLWGYLENKVFQTHSADFNNLKHRNSEEINANITSHVTVYNGKCCE